MSSRPSIPLLLPRHFFNQPFIDDGGRLDANIAKVFQELPKAASLKVDSGTKGTHMERSALSAAKIAQGNLWHESDRTITYAVVDDTWEYRAGIYHIDQEHLPVDLAAPDTGFLVNVIDFAHLLRWNGTGWEWGPGDHGSGFFASFAAGVTPGTGWVADDGSTVSMLNSDGSLSDVTLPTDASYFRI